MAKNTDTDPYSQLTKQLTNKRTLKAVLKSVPIVKMREIHQKVNEVCTELENEHREAEQIKAKNEQLMSNMKQQMLNSGVPEDQIAQFFTKNV
ncbi:hypothetical protein HUO09_17490 [Vibrio sp. Y2-5]|uniref:H-NS family histone-like protein n=1 Tax=Vibrio sp. Y2-5 TaxID=2743977 RepID=UPI001660BFB8|nr:hypothetical protein [Vibrio sp. Y2-5]MBD0788151.1 hypothetical protein [Vibrio sp. Y2-5]